MPFLDKFPSMEEFIEQCGGDDGYMEPREEYDMLPTEYQETYSKQFSDGGVKKLSLDHNIPAKTRPIDYSTNDYYFHEGLGLGVHRETGLVVVFFTDQRENYVIPAQLFEIYLTEIISKHPRFREAIIISGYGDKVRKEIRTCEIVEPEYENTRGKISSGCLPFQALPIYFGYACQCGVIRIRIREIGRHKCDTSKRTRFVAFQKIAHVHGRMATNVEVFCPSEDKYLERLVRAKQKRPKQLVRPPVSGPQSNAIPDVHHHPLIKKIMHDIPGHYARGKVESMRESPMVDCISKVLMGAVTLLSANINQVNLAGLVTVRRINSTRKSWYFRVIQMHQTCKQYSRSMAELVHLILTEGPQTESTTAIRRSLDHYDDGGFELTPVQYQKLTGLAEFITAEERNQILEHVFTRDTLKTINLLVQWIVEHCLNKSFNEVRAVIVDDNNTNDTDDNILDEELSQENNDSCEEDSGMYLGNIAMTSQALLRTTCSSSTSTTYALYYPVDSDDEQEEEEEEEEEGAAAEEGTTAVDNPFVVYLGLLGSVYAPKQFARSMSAICYVSNACIILNVIRKARRHNMSLRAAELDADRALLDTDLYRIMMQVRTHYSRIGMSLARSEGNLFRLNFTTGAIFNASGHEVGDKDMTRRIFDRLYMLARTMIFDNRNEEELDYLVDHPQLNNGMASFTECVTVPEYSRYKHEILYLKYSGDISLFRKEYTKLSLILITLLHILCLPARSTEISQLTEIGTSFSFRGVYFLGSTLGFCYKYNKSANAKDPIIREIGPDLSRLFMWYLLVHRRIYLEETQVEDETKLYQFDSMLPDKIRTGVGYWFTYGMNNGQLYKFSEIRQILKRCIEFHYTKSVNADLEIYRLVYETIARTLGHSVSTSTEHYGTLANYPPSVNAADVLRSRHLAQVWHRLGLNRSFVDFDGMTVGTEPVGSDPVGEDIDADIDGDDGAGPDPSYLSTSTVNEDDAFEHDLDLSQGIPQGDFEDIDHDVVSQDELVVSNMLQDSGNLSLPQITPRVVRSHELPRSHLNISPCNAIDREVRGCKKREIIGRRDESVVVADSIPDPCYQDPQVDSNKPSVSSQSSPKSVSWNEPNNPASLARGSVPYHAHLPGYHSPCSPPYYALVSSYDPYVSSNLRNMGIVPQPGKSAGVSLYEDEASVSREVLLEARKRHGREKREIKERKREKKRKENEKISKREEKISRREENIRKREEKIRKREEKEKIRKREKREKRERKRAEEKAALASPVTPVKTLKVKDVHLYLSATRGPLYRSESPSGPSGPSGSPRAMPSGPPTPNLSARRLYPLISQSSTQRLAIPGSSSHPSRVQKPPPSSRSLGSPPLFPETPRRSLLSPQHLRQRITQSLQ